MSILPEELGVEESAPDVNILGKEEDEEEPGVPQGQAQMRK